MLRRDFLKAAPLTMLSSQVRTGMRLNLAESAARPPRITPMLYGPLRSDIDLGAWFSNMRQWGVKRWMSWLLPLNYPDAAWIRDIPFLANRLPAFEPYLNKAALVEHERTLKRAAQLSVQNGIDFWCMTLFPIFPVQDWQVAQRATPELFKSGKLDWRAPGVPELLKQEVRALKDALPMLRGVNIWIVEAPTTPLTREDLTKNREWETPLVKALDEVTQELNIEGMLFAHHYLHTVATQRNVFEMTAEFPRIILMEDISWPAESMLSPFLGFLPPEDQERLFRVNPVALNFLIDTEYTGQGILPSVYPRWWQENVRHAIATGAQMAMGRTFHWDSGYSDVNFNRLNAQMFVRLCYQPELDARELLGAATHDMFGNAIPERLVDILWETEPVLKGLVGIDGIYQLDHSRFPKSAWIDILYTTQFNPMFGIDDLFQPPGAKLYPPLTDDLTAYKQWRWQNKTVSKPAATYLAEKQHAIAWAESILPEVRKLSGALQPYHRLMFVQGYEILLGLAKGMALYVETAATHYAWGRGKTIDDTEARAKFNELAASFRVLASEVPENPFQYKERMLAMAEFLDDDLPRISPRHSNLGR